jgi:N-acyl-D-aspartate/D-glutamate deacylase
VTTTASTIDVLIREARVVDGTGNPWFQGDIAIAGERILDVLPAASISVGRAREVVEGSGMVACPGFVDILSHSIRPLMRDPRGLSKVTQGVTTEIMGEAWTPAPSGGKIEESLRPDPILDAVPEWRERARGWRRFSDWLEAMSTAGVTPNVASFLGGGTVREYARGMQMGPPDAGELDCMRKVVDAAMRDGALGVSYALIYPPEAYARTDELIQVCRVVGDHGGVYATHLRSESDHLHEAIREALEIGRRARLPVEIYHLKASGSRNWPRMADAIEMIAEARANGQDVTADMYPYPAGGTGLTSVLPPWVAAEGKLFERLEDPAIRARVRAEVLNPGGGWEPLGTLAGPEGVMPIGLRRPENRSYNGRRLSEIAAQRGQEWPEAVMDLLVSERQRVGTVYFMISEENIAEQLRQPWISIGSDAGGLDPAWAAELGPTHPRAYGCYPRIVGRYVREQHVIQLEDAIRKMSFAVAARVGLRDRGLLRPGCYADVVIFDPAGIQDLATFEEPHRLSRGVRDVWINGVRVLERGGHTGATPGKVLVGPAARRSY